MNIESVDPSSPPHSGLEMVFDGTSISSVLPYPGKYRVHLSLSSSSAFSSGSRIPKIFTIGGIDDAIPFDVQPGIAKQRIVIRPSPDVLADAIRRLRLASE